MHYDLSILFFLKKGKRDKVGSVPIYCRMTVNGERAEISTNEKVEPDKWDSTIKRIRGRSELVRSTNNHLDIIESKIKSFFNKCIENNEQVSAKNLKDLLSGKKHKKNFLIKVFEENNKLIKLEEGSK